MGKRKKKTRRDTAEIARSVVEQAIGEKMSGEPLDQPDPTNDQTEKAPIAVESGRRGGLKGGPARAKRLTADQRSKIARKAARARWGRNTDDNQV